MQERTIIPSNFFADIFIIIQYKKDNSYPTDFLASYPVSDQISNLVSGIRPEIKFRPGRISGQFDIRSNP